MSAAKSRSPRKLRKSHTGGALRAVVDETIALFHRLRWVAEQIYGEEGRSTAKRGVLRGLVRYGPQTVPQLARFRAARRQSIQEVVDALREAGLVELQPNEAKPRSPLVRATRRGQDAVAHMDAVDLRVLNIVARGLTPEDLEITAQTLKAVRERFERSPAVTAKR